MRYFILFIISCILIDAKEITVSQLFNVQTVKVQKSSYAKTLSSYGFVKADESLIYDVSPRFGGFVEILYADALYKKVLKNEVLAQVYSPEVLKAKEDYLSALNYSKANKNILNSAKTRLKLLNIPSKEIEHIQATKNTSSSTMLLSPAKGYIFKKKLHNNSSFNKKETLFEIVNLDKVWVELKIHQDQLQALEQIKIFQLRTPSSKKLFTAKKIDIYPKLDQKEESFTLRLEVENKDNFLRPGMYITAQMATDTTDYLTLPSTAVIRKNGKFYVFELGEYEGEYTPVEVDAELLNPDIYIIKNGLSVDDEVVNNALFMIDSDAQINGLY